MSVAYFIAFEKKLKAVDYRYKDMFGFNGLNLSEDDGILFQENLSSAEKMAVGNLFQQRAVYSVRASVPFEFNESYKLQLSEGYYQTARNQIIWLKKFIKERLKKSHEVFFIRMSLGHKIDYSKIVSEYIDVEQFEIPEKDFTFEPLVIYQFVDNSEEHIDWMKKNP